ncbi:MAG: hypothetical protein V1789_01285 [PVC group bacterium]
MHRALLKTQGISTESRRRKTAARLPLPVLILTSLLLPVRCISKGAPGRPEDLPLCVVVDIDRTITDGRFRMRTSHKVPLPWAPDALRRIESDGVKIIYNKSKIKMTRYPNIAMLGEIVLNL